MRCSVTGSFHKNPFDTRFGALALCACLLLSACATPVGPRATGIAHVPLQRGWFEGQVVFYITTDVSDAAVAKDKGANFAPRLAHALPERSAPGRPTSVDKVYAFTNSVQDNVFASAPKPMGYLSSEAAYSPLWLMMTVTWKPGTTKRVLVSEEDVLDASEKGLVVLASSGVVVNCPIVHRGAMGGLPGVTVRPD